jgi:hypothetical protein
MIFTVIIFIVHIVSSCTVSYPHEAVKDQFSHLFARKKLMFLNVCGADAGYILLEALGAVRA